MCTSPGSTFAWVGAILVNIGFISLVAWGSSTLWPLGFVLSGLYTAFLFGLASWLDARHRPTLLPTNETEAETNTRTPAPHRTVLISVLYALGVISLGVTGYFVPQNIFSCEDNYDYDNRNYPTWTTDINSLPKEVRKWANQDYYDFEYASSFAYIPATETTIFRGSSNKSMQPVVWVVSPQAPIPQKHDELQEPEEFTSVNNRTACFDASDNGGERLVYCSGGQSFRPAKDSQQMYTFPRQLLASGNLLWFKADPARYRESGTLLYSLEPDSMMNLTLHSTLKAADPNKPTSCDDATITRQRAIGAFFLTALPITIASMLLCKQKQVPTMGATTYLGCTLLFVTAYIPFDPDMNHFEQALNWWLTVTGGAYTLALSYLLLAANPSIPKGPLKWGLNIGGLAYSMGIEWVVFNGGWMDRNTLWRWILVNLVSYIPLTLLGVVTDALFLAFLGALGFFWDAGRFAQYVGSHMPSSVVAPVEFLVFAVAGLAIAVMGYQLSKYQDSLKQKVTSLLQHEDRSEQSIEEAVPHVLLGHSLISNETVETGRPIQVPPPDKFLPTIYEKSQET